MFNQEFMFVLFTWMIMLSFNMNNALYIGYLPSYEHFQAIRGSMSMILLLIQLMKKLAKASGNSGLITEYDWNRSTMYWKSINFLVDCLWFLGRGERID